LSDKKYFSKSDLLHQDFNAGLGARAWHDEASAFVRVRGGDGEKDAACTTTRRVKTLRVQY
jgi:hypothetical protein